MVEDLLGNCLHCHVAAEPVPQEKDLLDVADPRGARRDVEHLYREYFLRGERSGFLDLQTPIHEGELNT